VITHAYIPDKYVPTILNADVTGQQLYGDYVSEQISGDVSLWAPVKKDNNKMFMCTNKKTTVKLQDKTVDLRETKNLYGRLMVLARTSKDINQKEAIGNHEFTLTPTALFSRWYNPVMPGQIKVDPSPQQVGNSRNSTGRSADRRLDSHRTRCSKSQDSPGRRNGSSAEDDQETSNHSDSQRSQ